MVLLQWLTFITVTIGTVFAGRRAVQGWLYAQRDRREARRVDRAGWSAGGVDTWTVRLAEPDASPGTGERPVTVTLTVCDRRGPSADQADRLRRYLEDHEHLSRNPTPTELETLGEARDEAGRLAIRRAPQPPGTRSAALAGTGRRSGERTDRERRRPRPGRRGLFGERTGSRTGRAARCP